MELSLQVVEVRCVVYRVTLVCLGDYAESMSCCRIWMSSDSMCSPHVHRKSCFFVTSVPISLVSAQSYRRFWIRLRIYRSVWVRVFTTRVIGI